VANVNGAVATSYGYDANGNMISASGGKYASITYTSFNLPDAQSGVAAPALAIHGNTTRACSH